VVEGYMDVVALAQHDIQYAVATLGTATTAEHVDRLYRTVNDLMFCFDGDKAGRAAAWRALETILPLLRDGRQASFLLLPEGQDPDSVIRGEGRAAFEERIERAAPLAEYLFAELRAQTDFTSLAGRARLAELARPFLEKLPEGHFRDLMEKQLQQEAQLVSTRLRRPPPSVASPIDRNPRLTRTPLRKAIALLLYRPELAQLTPIIDPVFHEENKEESGVKLLVNLLAILRSNPQLKTAALLERYRDTREGAILEQLATWEPGVPEQNYHFEQEFIDILTSLGRRNALREHLPDMLMRRGTPRALSPEEREALRNLGRTK